MKRFLVSLLVLALINAGIDPWFVSPAYAAPGATSFQYFTTPNASEQTWTVDATYNKYAAFAACIGPGGDGFTGQLSDSSAAGGGGGGGAYAIIWNPDLSGSVAYKVTDHGTETAVYLKNAGGTIILQCAAGKNGNVSALTGSNGVSIPGDGGSLINSVSDGMVTASGTEANNPFTTTAPAGSGSRIVTVAHTAHGLKKGEKVVFSGATATGGLDMNGTWAVDTVPTADTYTFKHTSYATSAASGGGAVVAYSYTTSKYFAGGGWGGCGGGAGGCLDPAANNNGGGTGGGGAGGPQGAGENGGLVINGASGMNGGGGGGAGGHNVQVGQNGGARACGASLCTGDGGSGPDGTGGGPSAVTIGANGTAGTAGKGAGGGGGMTDSGNCTAHNDCTNRFATNGGAGSIWGEYNAAAIGPGAGGGGGGGHGNCDNGVDTGGNGGAGGTYGGGGGGGGNACMHGGIGGAGGKGVLVIGWIPNDTKNYVALRNTTLTTFTLPNNVSSIDSIEAIGAGGDGGIGVSATSSGGGGGSGAWGKVNTPSIAASATVNVRIAAHGAGVSTYFETASAGTKAVEAGSGVNASANTGGTAGACVTCPNGSNAGAAGGNGGAASNRGGGGGAGSAGATGVGKVGGADGAGNAGGGGGGSNGGSSTAGGASVTTTPGDGGVNTAGSGAGAKANSTTAAGYGTAGAGGGGGFNGVGTNANNYYRGGGSGQMESTNFPLWGATGGGGGGSGTGANATMLIAGDGLGCGSGGGGNGASTTGAQPLRMGYGGDGCILMTYTPSAASPPATTVRGFGRGPGYNGRDSTRGRGYRR